jgi:hypothetical protein
MEKLLNNETKKNRESNVNESEVKTKPRKIDEKSEKNKAALNLGQRTKMF